MILNNIVDIAIGPSSFTIESQDQNGTDGPKKFTVSKDRNLKLSRQELPGAPPYSITAKGQCGSASTSGVGADDVVTYYWARFPEGGKRGENKVIASSSL